MTKNIHPPSGSKKAIYALFTVIAPLIILVIIELLLRIFGVGHSLDLFINHPNKDYKNYYLINPGIGEKYFSKFEATAGSNDIILKKKPENGYRIFVLGSSTMVGFPYGTNLMSSRILHKRLEDAYPNKHIEVVNTAITAINSITLRDYLNDIVKYEPDAIVFYAGHNEYYGAFGVGSHELLTSKKSIYQLHFKLMKLRMYQLLRKTIEKIAAAASPSNNEGTGTLMKRIVADKSITYKSEKYLQGIEQYQSNLTEILSICNKKDIDIYLSDLISNIKDLSPFGETEKFSALAEFQKAQQFELEMNFTDAKKHYHLAKDYDGVRFRAADTINQIIYRATDKYNCQLIEMKKHFENASPNSLVGNNLLTEHVHPNIMGQFVMADAFFQSIVKSNAIDTLTSVYANFSTYYYHRNWGYTDLDSLIGVHKISQLKTNWPFVSYDYSGPTYRDTYTPKSSIDSLAFTVIRQYNVDIEKLHKDYASELFKKGEIKKAYWEFESLLRSNPANANYYNLAAQCLLKLNEFYLAEKYLLKSLSYNETRIAWLYLADIQLLKHDYSAAIESLLKVKKLITNDKEEASRLEKIYTAYYFSKNIEEAKKVLKTIKKTNAGFNQNIPPATFSLYQSPSIFIKDDIDFARKLIAEDNLDSALHVLNKSLSNWHSPFTMRMIGDIYYTQQNNKLLDYYNLSYETFKYDPTFLSKLCIANYVNSNKEEMQIVLNELKQIDPENNAIVGLDNLVKKINK